MAAPRVNRIEDMPFRLLCERLDRVTIAKRKKKHELLMQLLDMCKGQNLFPLLRLILPQCDAKRNRYQLRETSIGKLFVSRLGIARNSEDAEKITKWKDPGKSGPKGVGDFSAVLYEVLKNRITVPPNAEHPTIRQVNQLLDELHDASQDIGSREKLFMELVAGKRHLNAREIMWLIRIITKDLKIGVKQNSLFKRLHPAAEEQFNSCADLEKLCEWLLNPVLSGVQLFDPIKPMLASKDTFAKMLRNMGHRVVVEIKFDGERVMIHKRGAEVKLYTRNTRDTTATYGYGQHLTPIVQECVTANECIIDGELVSYNTETESLEAFGSNRSAAVTADGSRHLCYQAFDILMFNGETVTGLPLAQRRERLKQAVKEKDNWFRVVDQTPVSSLPELANLLERALDNRHEGLILKDLDTPYVPGERSNKWKKLKPDYLPGSDTMDLVVLGGYYGGGRRRSGDVSHFLLGVRDIQQADPPKFWSFCKVGSGYSLEELAQIREKLQPHWQRWNPRKVPAFFQGWRPEPSDVPDVWIDPQFSLVFEVLGFEIVKCRGTKFLAEHTLRFPRVIKVRFDKTWEDTMTIQQVYDIMRKNQGRFQHKRMIAEIVRGGEEGEEGDEEASDEEGAGGRKKKKPRKAKLLRPAGGVLADYLGADVSKVEKTSEMLKGKELCVMTDSSTMSKHDLEVRIAEHGGRFVQNPLPSTDYIIAGRETFKVKNQISAGNCDILTYDWLLKSFEQGRLLDFAPKFAVFLTSSSYQRMSEIMDEYGDSFTEPATEESVRETLKHTPNPEPINEEDQSDDNDEHTLLSDTIRALYEELSDSEQEDLSSEQNIFRPCCFYLDRYDLRSGKLLPEKPMSSVAKAVLLLGGRLSKKLSADVTHVVVASHYDDCPADYSRLDAIKAKLRRARERGIHEFDKYIVTQQWVMDSLTEGRMMDESRYRPMLGPQATKL